MRRIVGIICVLAALAVPVAASAQQCDTIAVPWYEDFGYSMEDSTGPIAVPLANCWVAYGDGNSSANITVDDMLEVSLGTDESFFLVLPPVALPADSIWFRFHVQYIGSVEFDYGVMTNVADTGSFIPIGDVPLEANSSLYELSYSTTGLQVTGSVRLAFRMRCPTYAMVTLDNFYIDRAVDCPMPETSWIGWVDTTLVTIEWPYNALNAGYVVTLDDTLEFYTTDTSLTIDSLEPNHEYRYELQAVCFSGYRTPRLEGMFRTACMPVSVPYYEDFDSCVVFEMPGCWLVLQGLQQSNAVTTVPCVLSTAQTNRFAFISVTDTVVTVATPMIAHPANRLHVSFDMRLLLGTRMEVGMVMNPHDLSTFTPVSSYEGEETGGMTHYDLYTESVADSNFGYVAFRWQAASINMNSYIDNVAVEVADSCHNPTDLRYDDVRQYDITLVWTDNSVAPAGYEVRYATTDNVDSAEHVYFTDEHSLYVDSLNVNTAYWFWVRSLCSDSTEWVPAGMVRTVCGQPMLPYFENFDSYQTGEIVQCWDYYFFGNSSVYGLQPYAYSAAQYAHSGTKVWEFRNPYSDTVMAVLPSFGINARALEVSFWLRIGYGKLEAGLYDISTDQFTPVEVILSSDEVFNTSAEHVVFQCDTVDAANAFTRIAFRWSKHPYVPVNWAGQVAYVDDLLVRHIPLCRPPDSLTVYYLTDTSASIQIHDSWATGIYRVRYSTNGSVDTTIVIGTNVELTGLQHSSYYSVEVVGLCYDGTLTDATTMTFATACHTITHDVLPYVETFDNYTGGTRISPCWYRVGTNTAYSSYPIPYAGVFVGSSGASMQFLVDGSCSANNSELLVLPEVDYLNDLYVEFDVRTGNSYGHVIVGVMTNPNDPATFTPVDYPVINMYDRWQHFRVPLNNYSGMGTNVAIGAYCNNMYTYTPLQVYVDNVALRVIPQCSDSLTWLATTDVGESCASFMWDASIALNDSAVFVIHLLDSSGVEIRTDTTTATETMLCNLDEGTPYRAYVDLYCGGSTVATTMHQIGFTTRCADNNTLVVGVPETSLSSAFLPINRSALESKSEQIYRFPELNGAAGTINTIGIYQMSSNFNVQDVIYGTIYLAHTSDTIIRQWIPLDSMTAVYEGPINLTHGWNNISLSTPFHYNGTDNLVMAFSATLTGVVSSLAFGSRNEFDSASVFTYSGYSGYIWQRMRNIVRFHMCPDVLDICVPPTITSATSTDMTVTLSYTSDAPCEVHITRGWWNRSFVGEMDSTGTVTFTDLLPNTQYTVGVRQHCSNGDMSIWSIRRVTTQDVIALPPLEIELENLGYNTASVSWRQRANETHWELRLFNTVRDTIIALADTAYTFDDLISMVTYNVSVRSMCGSDYSIASPWSDTLTFTTDYCHPVSGVTVSNVTMTSANVSWVPSDNGVYCKVEYGYEGFQRGDAIASYIVEGSNSVNFDTLQPGQYYDVFVAAVCGPGMTSSWVGTNTFHTPADAGISTTPDGTGFVVYPNPASTMVTVRLDVDDPEARIAVIDQQGRTVATATGSVATIDVSHLSVGVYFVRLSGATYTSVKKLIVN